MQTTRFLITGVGGQGTILASDVLAEVGLRLGYDAKKSDILGLAVRGGSVVSHIIWGDKVRAPMIDEAPPTTTSASNGSKAAPHGRTPTRTPWSSPTTGVSTPYR